MAKEQTTTELQSELDGIINWFESDEVSIDDAAARYERGLAIIAELEKRLKTAENTVTKIKQAFDKSS